MRKGLVLFLLFILLAAVFLITKILEPQQIITGAPPYHISDDPIPEGLGEEYAWVADWKRPPGPPKVALQVGHLDNDDVPEELHRLRGNTGAEGGGMTEAEVNQKIAELTKVILESKGILVEILPATVPPRYWADVFVAIHADGNLDTTKTGYKGAVPRRDFTQSADELLKYVEEAYAASTGLAYDPEVTRNMRGYYAFSFWRFEHALHPMTTAMILETGFLTNPLDRLVIVSAPDKSALGLAKGIEDFLKSRSLL